MSLIHSRFSKPLPRNPPERSTVVHGLDALTDDEDDGHDHDSERSPAHTGPWRPVTLHTAFFAVVILITAALIASLALLTFISQRDQGVLFAQDVNNLPLARSFPYLYLPTLIAVIYSFLWAWVDLDIKRLEPYFQLSKPGGASGAESLLLAYPLEFLLTLPAIAYRQKHWSVLSASIVMILVFWCLTPTQAGIFATRNIKIHNELWGYRSEAYTPVAEQGNLSALYAQSVYNIAWLNETLPPLTTKEYSLGAFGPLESKTTELDDLTYTGPTFLYSVDVSCVDVMLWKGEMGTYYNSSNGCSFYAPPYRPLGGNNTEKLFDTMYVGYQNDNGIADYYLSSSCDDKFFHSFFIRWSKTTPAAIRSGNLTASPGKSLATETSLFCEPTYYRQLVNATIAMPNRTVLETSPLSSKIALPGDMFNSTRFEWMMSAGSEVSVRGEYPTTTFPNQKTHMLDTGLNLAYLPKMAPFAIATYQRPLEEYLDAETFRLSYQSAYRLLFARQMAEILKDERNWTIASTLNQEWYATQAIVVVPGFAYAAMAMLALVLLLAVGLLFKVRGRANRLTKDPATIGAVMDLVDGDRETTEKFVRLSGASTETLQKSLATETFELGRCEQASGLRFRIRGANNASDRIHDGPASYDSSDEQTRVNDKQGVRPFEFKLVIGTIFFVLQLAALVTFAILFVKSRRENGLPLPSQSTFVRQMVQNYIPILIATLIEPFWLLLNRLLCLLQPYEQLRRGGARASRSIDLDYSSLPPQFLFWRAARARHWVVFLVCMMVLAANVLSVALSGLMYEGSRDVSSDAVFSLPRAARFVSLNGTGLPFNTNEAANWQGGTTSDQFYSLMSNLTAGTPLPPWVDEDFAYLAVNTTAIEDAASMTFNTTAIGAAMQCRPLEASRNESYRLAIWHDAKFASLDVQIDNGGSTARCTHFQAALPLSETGGFQIEDTQVGRVALELATMLVNHSSDTDDIFCRQHVLVGWIRAHWAFNSTEKYLYGSPQGIHSTDRTDTVMLCRPTLQIGPAEVSVDGTGQVQGRRITDFGSHGIEEYFSSSPSDLIAQVHQFLPDMGATWHQDAYPSDFINYLIVKGTNDTTLLDSTLAIPPYDLAEKRFSKVYRQLFAILIGSNQERLFEAATPALTVVGQLYTPKVRILFSLPAFVVVESILLCYVLVTIFFYARRPWKILPRLPSSVASTIAFCAASRSFQEMCEGRESNKGAEEVQEGWSWAYGNFIGIDGKPHVGVEREPLVSVLQDGTPPPRPMFDRSFK